MSVSSKATAAPRLPRAARRGAETIVEALARAAERDAERPCIVLRDARWTLADLIGEAQRVGAWIEGLVRPRAPVLLVPTNTPDSIAFLIGAIARGRVPILADPAWTSRELEALMARDGVAAVFWPRDAEGELDGKRESFGAFAARLKPGETRICERGIAFGRFTSGTTGAPRCLAFSESAALAAARNWAAASGYGSSDRVLCLATLNNGLAFNAALLAVLLARAQLVFHGGKLLPRALARTMRATDPTVLVAFPFVYNQLTSTGVADDSLAALRLAVSSAARLDPKTKLAWSRKSKAPICDYYGLVEVGPCTFNDGSDVESVGRVLGGVSIKVTRDDGRTVDRGETGRIRVRTESMARDFLDPGEPRFASAIDRDGYYVTQDMGYVNEDDRLHLTGRVGRQINIEGRKIEPTEVEVALRELSGVRDAVVVAEPGDVRPVLAAYVEASGLSERELRVHCSALLAPYKIPQRIEIVDQLPRSSTGKVSVGTLAPATTKDQEVDA